MGYDPQLHVITGGPGGGKSTLIAALRDAGHAVAEEAGRAVIREQVAAGGNALPWADRQAYVREMLVREMLVRDQAAWRAAREQAAPTFFDRGVPDILGYLRLMAEPEPADLIEAVGSDRYAREIFVAPPWEAIFGQDAERKQDFAEPAGPTMRCARYIRRRAMRWSRCRSRRSRTAWRSCSTGRVSSNRNTYCANGKSDERDISSAHTP